MEAQLGSFLTGLYELVPKAEVALFTTSELRRLLNGEETVDVDRLRRHTRYQGGFAVLKERSPTVMLFWDAMRHSFDSAQRSRVLLGT